VCRRGVHATQMLREEVFAVEVVMVDAAVVMRVYRCGTQVAAPEAKFNVLSADVSLPLILRDEVGGAAIGGKGAWEGPLRLAIGRAVTVCVGCFRGSRGYIRPSSLLCDAR